MKSLFLSMAEWTFRAAVRAFSPAFQEKVGADLLQTYRQVRAEKMERGFWQHVVPYVLKSPVLTVRDALMERNTKGFQASHARSKNGRGILLALSHGWNDLQLTARQSFRSPGFLITSSLTFAVGLAATATVYSIVDNVLLRPLPYDDSRALVQLGSVYPGSQRLGSVSLPNFEDIAQRGFTLEAMATVRGLAADVTGDDAAERVAAAGVSSQFFAVLRVSPFLGRLFTTAENGVDAPLTAVLDHRIWIRRWGGRESVIGTAVTINNQSHTIIGVLPEDFRGPEGLGLGDVDIWLPRLTPFLDRPVQERDRAMFRVLGRIADSHSEFEVQQQLDQIALGLAAEYPDANTVDGTPIGLRIVPLLQQTVSNATSTLLTLLGAVSIILFIAVANVINLLIVRSLERRRELQLKVALGSSTARLLRPILMESVFVMLLGGIVGVGLAMLGVEVFRSMSPGDIPRLGDVSVDWRVFLVAVSASIVLGLIAGLIPALRSLRQDPAETLREARRGTGMGARTTAQRTLVVTQTALALSLSVGAGLLINSFVRLSRVDPGFDIQGISVLQVYVGNAAISGSATHRTSVATQLIQRIGALPGVTSAATTLSLPLGSQGSKGDIPFTTLERPDVEQTASFMTWVGPNYFRTMGISFTEPGREFHPTDTGNDRENVVIVNNQLARAVWPGQPAVGKRILFGLGSSSSDSYTVIGVVADVHNATLTSPDVPSLYFVDRGQIIGPPLYIVVRSTMNPQQLIPQLRETVRVVDPTVPVGAVGPLAANFDLSVARPRFYTVLLSAFAGVALVLAAVGIYGSLAYAVNQRTHEVGVRIACGAVASKIVWLVVRQGLIPVAIGVFAGLAVAAASMRALSQFLYGVDPIDPLTLMTASAVLVLFAGTACFIPALRAARIDPMNSLRD